MDLCCLQIIALCLYLHFAQHPNFFGIGAVILIHTVIWQRRWRNRAGEIENEANLNQRCVF